VAFHADIRVVALPYIKLHRYLCWKKLQKVIRIQDTFFVAVRKYHYALKKPTGALRLLPVVTGHLYLYGKHLGIHTLLPRPQFVGFQD